ncbi:MAG: hypothetical protein ACMXYL_03185 [Candidatus Woesearchaeota archaeon]
MAENTEQNIEHKQIDYSIDTKRLERTNKYLKRALITFGALGAFYLGHVVGTTTADLRSPSHQPYYPNTVQTIDINQNGLVDIVVRLNSEKPVVFLQQEEYNFIREDRVITPYGE